MAAEHYEMVQREMWLGGNEPGNPIHPVPLVPTTHLTNDSFVTTNCALDLGWCRTKARQLWMAMGLDPETPGILWQVSLVFVFNGTVPPDSRWLRYQQAMDPYVLRDAQGNRVAYPKYPGPPGQPYIPEPGWALVPSQQMYDAMRTFWTNEYSLQTVDDRMGLFFDSASNLVYAKWKLMVPGIPDDALRALASQFRSGRDVMLRQMRDHFGESIVLMANWAKDKWSKPHDTMPWLNGLTFEGDPLFVEHRRWAQLKWWQNVRGGRRHYGCLWNTYPSLLPAPPLFDYMARHGSHWSERHGG